MDPIRNPYAPGAGQRPPELAGRDRELEQFEVTLERVAAGRPERSMVLSGLRGVGKTVLLNALRGQAVSAPGAPARSRRGPTRASGSRSRRRCTRRCARSGTGTATRTGSTRSGASEGFALRTGLEDRKPRQRQAWTPPLDVPATKGRADSGDLELDLVELFTDAATWPQDLGVGIALFVDEMQDIATAELAALCGACHEISQQGAPLLVVGAGLPHLPAALAAASRTPSGCSATSPSTGCPRAWPTAPDRRPAATRASRSRRTRSTSCTG